MSSKTKTDLEKENAALLTDMKKQQAELESAMNTNDQLVLQLNESEESFSYLKSTQNQLQNQNQIKDQEITQFKEQLAELSLQTAIVVSTPEPSQFLVTFWDEETFTGSIVDACNKINSDLKHVVKTIVPL